MNNLTVSLVQSHLIWEDIPANLQHFEKKLIPLKGYTDIIILPEMFTTGFSMNPSKLAENMEGSAVNWMKKIAAQVECALMGSVIIEENQQYYNRLIWMEPDGNYAIYDKKHLFTLAGEHHYYQSGTKHLLVKWKGWKILPLICYDLRFPVWARNTFNYDLLVYVANWPRQRSNAWKSLLVARAIENQSYCIGVNRVGIDGKEHSYSGDSALIDYAGTTIIQAAEVETILTTTINKEAQQEFRTKLAFLADRDHFEFQS